MKSRAGESLLVTEVLYYINVMAGPRRRMARYDRRRPPLAPVARKSVNGR